MTVKSLPNKEQDEMQAELEHLRRIMPSMAEAMKIAYDAYIEQGFSDQAAQRFVAVDFLSGGN